MLKKVLFSVFLLSTFMMVGQDNWKRSSIDEKDNVVFVQSHMPSQYQIFNLDLNEIKTELQTIEKRENVSLLNATTTMSFPDANGKMQRFKLLEDPIMEDALAAKFPMIKTYIGQGIDDRTATLRMSIGTDGVHVMVLASGKSALLIDPYTQDRSKYIVYSADKLPTKNDFVCGVQNSVDVQTTAVANKNAIDGKMRQYRLAVACTIEYSAYHLANQGVPATASLATKKAAVLSAIVNTVNRVTGIYQKETAVKFVLVANNSNIIFIDSDNFTNNSSGALIGESQTVITSVIGSANFDVGHTFSTGGGGLATLGSICKINQKARGITGSSQPIGDFYDVDYVAHEMGHQFGANHTFNGTTGNCSGNRNISTSAEPGSGTTIMAYAGICAPGNVQANSDAYFNYFSLQEIYARLTSAPTCAAITQTGNNEPSANAGADKIIPKGTAFILEGQGIDIDGDAVTYCWEQIDTANNNVPLQSTSTAGPTYRSFSPTTSPNRFMPAFATVAGGSVSSTWEVTPTVARTLTFALTTRDNRADGGQTKSDTKLIIVNGTAGPFTVTSQTANETWTTGQSKTVTWNVAGTNANGINTTAVDIMLVDGITGSVLSTLMTGTVNDGSQVITVPNITSTNAKIMVRANGNIFYALNSGLIGVNANATCTNLCPSTGRTQFPDGTTLVQFNTINNASTGASAYSDYTGISTTVVKGTAYNLTVNVNTDGNFTEETIVWIDWNRDCVFNTTDEEYHLGDNTNVTNAPTSLSPLSITVPATASDGSTTMRVSSAYIGGLQGGGSTTLPGSCDTNFIGEVEDYTIVVTSGAATNDMANFAYFNLSPNPNNGDFSISLKSDETSDISVKVFDVIGRQVFNESYDNNQSIFTKNIKLNDVQPGIYLVNISDGVRFNTERIIIK